MHFLSRLYTSTIQIIDLAVPRECFRCGVRGVWLCSACAAACPLIVPPLCPICVTPTTAGITHMACRCSLDLEVCLPAVSLTHPSVQELVYGLKYRGLKSATASLATLIMRALDDVIGNTALSPDAVLCPIPLHPQRERERGYNQAHLLAESLASMVKSPCRQLLRRARLTQDQVKLDRGERRKNLAGAFEGTVHSLPAQVLLIDDVITSGATMHAAAATLRQARKDITIWGLAAAYHQT